MPGPKDPFGFEQVGRIGLYFHTQGERYRTYISCEYNEELEFADRFYQTFFLAIGAWCEDSWHPVAVEIREACDKGESVSLGATRLKELLDDCVDDLEPYFDNVGMHDVGYDFIPDPELN